MGFEHVSFCDFVNLCECVSPVCSCIAVLHDLVNPFLMLFFGMYSCFWDKPCPIQTVAGSCQTIFNRDGRDAKDAAAFTEDIVVLGTGVQMLLDDFTFHPTGHCLDGVLPAVLLISAPRGPRGPPSVQTDCWEETNHLLAAGVVKVHTVEFQQMNLADFSDEKCWRNLKDQT